MNIQEFLAFELINLGEYRLTPAMLLGVIIVWLAALLLLRGIKRVLLQDQNRFINLSDKGRRHSFYLIVQYLIWTIAVAIMLESIGIHVTVILAGSAALLVGIGLGIQQIFQDIISGVFLLFEGSIEVGDVLVVDNMVGKVSEINLRTSKLTTKDGNTLIVPNHKFITQTVHNWSHRDQQPSRFSTLVGVHYSSDAALVRRLLEECVALQDNVLQGDHARRPQVRLKEFSLEKIIFEILFWTEQKFEVDELKSTLNMRIREKLSEHGVDMSGSPV